MTKHTAGSHAKPGYYLNLSSWSIHGVAEEGERLPGEPGQSWVAIPTTAALMLAPILGLAFVVFLPFIGFVLVAQAALRPALKAFRHEAGELAATMSPGWRPGEAHLTGKREEEGKAAEGQGPPKGDLEKLAKEIEARRDERK
jgi:hypothetical protein